MSNLNATGLSEDCERKFGGMELSDAKKLKALKDENNRLKKMVADLMLDNTMLRDVNSKKW